MSQTMNKLLTKLAGLALLLAASHSSAVSLNPPSEEKKDLLLACMEIQAPTIKGKLDFVVAASTCQCHYQRSIEKMALTKEALTAALEECSAEFDPAPREFVRKYFTLYAEEMARRDLPLDLPQTP